MANNQVFFKRSAVPGKKPLANNINLGQLAINTYDGRLYTKRAYIDEDSNPVEAIVEFVGKVPVGNAFFVSVNGSDLNDVYPGIQHSLLLKKPLMKLLHATV